MIAKQSFEVLTILNFFKIKSDRISAECGLNDIEHDFSALKRARMYSHSATSLDEIIRAPRCNLMSHFYLK